MSYLLSKNEILLGDKSNEQWERPALNDNSGVFVVAWRYVGQRPTCLHLNINVAPLFAILPLCPLLLRHTAYTCMQLSRRLSSVSLILILKMYFFGIVTLMVTITCIDFYSRAGTYSVKLDFTVSSPIWERSRLHWICFSRTESQLLNIIECSWLKKLYSLVSEIILTSLT